MPDQEITHLRDRQAIEQRRPDTVDSIVAEITRSDKGMKDLIKMIVLSKIFRTN